ncbi:MAG: Hsp70 family protein [Blautia sp.]
MCEQKLLNAVLRYAHCPVSTILLMGGSTKNPILKSLLEKDYPGFEISGALNPDESVAQGAGKRHETSCTATLMSRSLTCFRSLLAFCLVTRSFL